MAKTGVRREDRPGGGADARGQQYVPNVATGAATPHDGSSGDVAVALQASLRRVGRCSAGSAGYVCLMAAPARDSVHLAMEALRHTQTPGVWPGHFVPR